MQRANVIGLYMSWATMATVLACASSSQSVPVSAGMTALVPGAPVGVTAFMNVNVVPMDSERILPRQSVLVEGGRITALGPSSQVKVPASAVRIDGRDSYLMPGLGDCHTHLHSALDSAAAERRLFLWLANGITTVRNMDYLVPGDVPEVRLDPTIALRLRTRAAAGKILSPQIYTSGPWARRQYTGPASNLPAPRLDSVAAYLTAYKTAGYDFIKVHDESLEILDSIAVVARRLGLPIVGHVMGASGSIFQRNTRKIGPEDGLAWAVKVNLASIEHLTVSTRSLNPRDTVRIRALAAATRQANVAHCPTQIRIRENGGTLPGDHALIKALQEAGATLLAGTDAPLSGRNKTPGGMHGDPSAIHEELEEFVLAGLTPYQALATGTRNMAVVLGRLDESGTVAVGKRADLVLLNANPLANIRHTRQITGVMIGGRWLAREVLDRHVAASGER